MKRKQVIAFVSAAALAVTSLAGCGKTEEKTEIKLAKSTDGNSKSLKATRDEKYIKCRSIKKECRAWECFE